MEIALGFLVVLSVLALVSNRNLISHFLIGGLCCLPLILIDPLFRVGYFEQLSTVNLLSHFGEQFLFTFLFGGLSAVSYEIIFSPIFHRRSTKRHNLYFLLLGIIVVFGLLVFSDLSFAFSVIIGLSVNTVLLLLWRSDLIWDAIFSAIGTGLLYTLLFSIIVREPGKIEGIWLSGSLSGLTIAGLPIEELLVIALFGAFFGPIYIAAKSRYEQ